MRIAAVTVGTDGQRFRCVDSNDERLELARRIASFTQGDGRADVVLLPAGFLAVDDGKIGPKARSLASIFKQQVLLAGVDEEDEESKGASRLGKGESTEDSSEGYRYWAFASDAGRVVGGPWWQRTARSGQVSSNTEARVVRVGTAKIGVLICGELYNPALAESLKEEKPDLVIDLAHLSMKRFTKSLRRVAKTLRCPVLHVQHVAWNSGRAAKWKATPRGLWGERKFDWASYDEEDSEDDALWAEVRLWEI